MSKVLAAVALFVVAVPVVWQVNAQPTGKGKAVSAWIWLDAKPKSPQTVYFRKEITLKHKIKSAKLYGTCDNQMTVYVNGKEALASDAWETPVFRDVVD